MALESEDEQMNIDLLNVVVAAIAIITFLPFLIATLRTPQMQLVYETNTYRMAYRIFGFVFAVVLRGSIMYLVYALYANSGPDTSKATMLSYVAVIYLFLVTFKRFIYKVTQDFAGLFVTVMAYFIVAIVLLVTSGQNIGIIIIYVLSGALLIINRASISTKSGECRFMKFRDEFINSPAGQQIYRLSTVLMNLVACIYMGVTIGMFSNFPPEDASRTMYALIFGVLAIIMIIEFIALTYHDGWMILNAYCFVDATQTRFYKLDSLTDNFAVLYLYSVKSVGNPEVHLVDDARKNNDLVIPSSELTQYKRVENPIPNPKYY
jgi:hypothetical protein